MGNLAEVESEREAILAAKEKGLVATAATYTRLSGPGWLQSALTLGGGSLASSLFLGVLAGFGLLWLQPVAMILGIIMLSAIGYVALSTKERPFQAINRHINPVLGWGWALASLAANMVWALPQYSLASGVLQQNLLPGLLGEGSSLPDFWCKVIISGAILLITMLITFTYDSGGWGIKAYEFLLKLVVAGIVACFVGVVCVLTASGTLNWSEIWRGFIPDLTKVYRPAEGFDWLLAAVGDATLRDFWITSIVSEQRDVMISAAATAVGINMTFLLPYSMLRRGWGKDFRGLAKFDLSTGMFIPFVLATSCVVIASATQFHPAVAEKPLVEPENEAELPELPPFLATQLTEGRLEDELGKAAFAKLTSGEVQQRIGPLGEADVRLARRLMVFKYHLPASAMAETSEDDLKKRLEPFGWSVIISAKKMMHERLKERLGHREFARLAPESRAVVPTALKYRVGNALFHELTPEQIEAQLEPLSHADLLLASNLKPSTAFQLANRLQIDRLRRQLGKETFQKLSDAEIERQVEPLTPAEALLAVHLQRKDAFDLARSLQPLTGRVVADMVFGVGVLGMTLSSITLLMLISGFVICEMFGLPPTGWPNRLGTLAATTGVLGPFLWSTEARFWLAVPTSVFGMILLPIAYLTFFCMMNSRNLLGDEMPRGLRRLAWNLAMGVAVLAAGAASVYMVWVKAGYYGLAGVAAFLLLVVAVHFARPRNSTST